MKTIKIFSILCLLLMLNACLMVGKRDYFMFNEKIYLKNGKIDLDSYIGKDPEIIRNNNDIFITSVSKNIVKISLDNGKIEWIKTINTIPENNFVFDDKYLYFNGINNNFYILNYESGEIEYIYINSNSKTITNVEKPILYKNIIVAFFNNNKIIILDRNSKKILLDKNYNDKFSVEKNENILIINNEEILDLNLLK